VLLNISQQGTAQGDAASRGELAGKRADTPPTPRRERMPVTQTWRPAGRS
jgi:hypothetical protein